MKVKIQIPNEEVVFLEQMCQEGNISIADLVLVGVHNLVALWMREKGDTIPVDSHYVVDDVVLVAR